MEVIHLKQGDGTKCGFKPNGFKSAYSTTDVTCWDCLNSQYSNFDFNEEIIILEKEKNVFLKAVYQGNIVASLKYFYSISFFPIITDVWVHQEFRGCGLGSMIMKKIMKKVGPPIQLKAEPYQKSKDEAEGLGENDLKSFYSKLGFVGLKNSKMMLWYPVVKNNGILSIKINTEGNSYTASVVDFPMIKGTGKSYESSIGNLIQNHELFFGINLVKEDVNELRTRI